MAPGDRYEPLPGLAELPAFLLRRLSPRGRIVVAAVAFLVLAGAVLAVTAVEREDRGRGAGAQRAADRTAELRAEMRPQRGDGTPARGLEGARAVTARRALVADLAAAIEVDAAARELDRPVERVTCERYPRGARGEDPATELASRSGRYSCLAVTGTIAPTELNPAGNFGYPYRALVDFRRGRFTFCKVSGRPGEGSTTAHIPVRVPPACGGD